jgi:hypothetical protein
MNPRVVLAPLCLAVLWFTALPADAAVLKCKAKDGSITYTQTTCPPGTTNADFSEHANPNHTPGPGAAATSAGPSSPLAIAYGSHAYDCVEDEDVRACRLIEEAMEVCTPERNWSTENCIALREGIQAARQRLTLTDEYSQQRLRQLCAKGARSACSVVECPLDLFVNGSEVEVRACAARASLPVTATWIRTEERMLSLGNTRSSFVCLKKLERVTGIGERIGYRETITVLSLSKRDGSPSQHRASSLPDETFPTAHAAATAGCDAKTTSEQPQAPKVPRKGQQAI